MTVAIARIGGDELSTGCAVRSLEGISARQKIADVGTGIAFDVRSKCANVAKTRAQLSQRVAAPAQVRFVVPTRLRPFPWSEIASSAIAFTRLSNRNSIFFTNLLVLGLVSYRSASRTYSVLADRGLVAGKCGRAHGR
jgi:hypothetical protein